MFTKKVICNWRISRGVPSGMHIWFDPSCESVVLHRVPSPDQRSHYYDIFRGVDLEQGVGYLDRVGSVSGLEDEDGDLGSHSENNGPDLKEDLDLPF